MGLCRMTVAMATTMGLITTVSTKAGPRLMEIPTITHTTIPTISHISPDTTITGKAEVTPITTTTITALMIAAPVSLEPAVPAACWKCASDEMIAHQSSIKHQPVSKQTHSSVVAGNCSIPQSQLPPHVFILLDMD